MSVLPLLFPEQSSAWCPEGAGPEPGWRVSTRPGRAGFSPKAQGPGAAERTARTCWVAAGAKRDSACAETWGLCLRGGVAVGKLVPGPPRLKGRGLVRIS